MKIYYAPLYEDATQGSLLHIQGTPSLTLFHDNFNSHWWATTLPAEAIGKRGVPKHILAKGKRAVLEPGAFLQLHTPKNGRIMPGGLLWHESVTYTLREVVVETILQKRLMALAKECQIRNGVTLIRPKDYLWLRELLEQFPEHLFQKNDLLGEHRLANQLLVSF